jgi:hypothetical protein
MFGWEGCDSRLAEVRDTVIAGIVLASRATLATRNTQHFEDLPLTVINPWKISSLVGGRRHAVFRS